MTIEPKPHDPRVRIFAGAAIVVGALSLIGYDASLYRRREVAHASPGTKAKEPQSKYVAFTTGFGGESKTFDSLPSAKKWLREKGGGTIWDRKGSKIFDSRPKIRTGK
jgi:hypothetical protein